MSIFLYFSFYLSHFGFPWRDRVPLLRRVKSLLESRTSSFLLYIFHIVFFPREIEDGFLCKDIFFIFFLPSGTDTYVFLVYSRFLWGVLSKFLVFLFLGREGSFNTSLILTRIYTSSCQAYFVVSEDCEVLTCVVFLRLGGGWISEQMSHFSGRHGTWGYC